MGHIVVSGFGPNTKLIEKESPIFTFSRIQYYYILQGRTPAQNVKPTATKNEVGRRKLCGQVGR